MTDNLQLPDNILKELKMLMAYITADASVRSVIVFGSTARGTRSEHSDIDLLILVDKEDSEQIRFASMIRHAAFGKVCSKLLYLIFLFLAL